MDKDNNNTERDVPMAMAKEPKNVRQATTNDHDHKISKAIKEITSKHPKLLKKLAE